MGKIVLMVPRETMIYMAHNILQEHPYAIGEMKVVSTEQVVEEAKEAVQNGASVIIARGVQASLIKQSTEVPVAEIVLTAQEMGLLVMKAKEIVKREMPVIAVVGFKNMFCDMTYFNQLYQVDLRTYFARDNESLEGMTKKAIEESADLIIGGDIAVKTAKWMGVPSLFLSATEDSLKNAFEAAERINYAIETEKRNAAQIETMLDYSFGGMIHTDRNGKIVKVSPGMEGILKCAAKELTGKRLVDVLPELDKDKVDEILKKGNDNYSLCMQIHQTAVYGILVPVTVEDKTTGAILSCNKIRKPQAPEETAGGKGQSGTPGKPALFRFSDLMGKSEAMKEAVSLARLYSQSEKPVLIRGETGTEKHQMAQGIHNNGDRSAKAFIEVSCEGIPEKDQTEFLFGHNGAVSQADGGTLFIHRISHLGTSNQFYLYRLITQKYYIDLKTSRWIPANVRIITTEESDLRILVREGRFRADLYYLLSGLVIALPPLRSRPEDLKVILETCVDSACDRYGRYFVLTHGALKCLLEYPWPGNQLQVEAFCDRLILTAKKRSLDEIVVKRLLEELYPMEQGICGPAGLNSASGVSASGAAFFGTGISGGTGRREETAGSGIPDAKTWCLQAGKREEQAILDALVRSGGNRKLAAQEMGISKTTLWRKMKQYGIDLNETKPI